MADKSPGRSQRKHNPFSLPIQQQQQALLGLPSFLPSLLHSSSVASSILPLSETACSSAIKGRRRWDRTLARGSHSFTLKDTSGSEDKAKKKDRERVAFLAELREALDSRFPKHTQPSLSPQRRNNNTIRIRPSSHLNRSCLGGLFLPPSFLRA